MTKDSKYKFIDVKNSGWLNNQIENYVAAVVNIDKSNYTREFIATAYAQIHYQDGSVETIYGSEGARYSDFTFSVLYCKADKIRFKLLQ